MPFLRCLPLKRLDPLRQRQRFSRREGFAFGVFVAFGFEQFHRIVEVGDHDIRNLFAAETLKGFDAPVSRNEIPLPIEYDAPRPLTSVRIGAPAPVFFRAPRGFDQSLRMARIRDVGRIIRTHNTKPGNRVDRFLVPVAVSCEDGGFRRIAERTRHSVRARPQQKEPPGAT